MRPQDPAAQGPNANDADGDNGIIQRLGVDWIQRREAENDSYEADPADADKGYWAAEDAEVEGSLFEDEGALVD